MRIISGRFKGKRFNNKIPEGIRPTMDFTRETIFNILQKLIRFDNILVCDVFAGTGAFGFEALSRGARKCVFIDINRQSFGLIKSLANELKLNVDEYFIVATDAVKFFKDINKSNLSFNLIFMDPPYRTANINQILSDIASKDFMCSEGIIVIEIASSEGIIIPQNFVEIDIRTLGKTKIIFLKKSI